MSHIAAQKLQKTEILRLKTEIEALFNEGITVKAPPLRVVYRFAKNENPLPAVMFVVSKRNVKKAVQRNRIKRCMREAYRLLKNDVTQMLAQKPAPNQQLQMALIYQPISDASVSAELMKARLFKAIKKIQMHLAQRKAKKI